MLRILKAKRLSGCEFLFTALGGPWGGRAGERSCFQATEELGCSMLVDQSDSDPEADFGRIDLKNEGKVTKGAAKKAGMLRS